MRWSTVFGLAVLASSALAQEPRPYDVGWFADAEGTQRALFVTPAAPFRVHAVVSDVAEPITGYELALVGVPAGVFRLQTEFFGPSPQGGEEFDYIVNTGGCVQPEGRTVLVAVDLLATGPVAPCTRLFLTAPVPSSSPQGAPAIQSCDGQTRDLGLIGEGNPHDEPGVLYLNPILPPPHRRSLEWECGLVSGESVSFGAIKARF